MSAGSLTRIEAVARELDDQRSTRLRDVSVDFDGYLQAREDDIGRVKSPRAFLDELNDEFYGEVRFSGRTMPWHKTHDSVRFRPGEVTVWTGFNGHMKSMVCGYVALDLVARQNETVCIASFEMKPRKTLKRMACQAIGTTKPTPEYVEKFLDLVQGNLFLYDQQGETSPQRVLGVIYYCAEKLGVTHFIVDSLMKVIGDEDDYNGQKKFVGQLCTAARDLNIHIHLVHHSRKREDESKRPGKNDAKGSGAIVDQVDNFIAVFKFPRKEGEDAEKPTHALYVDKQRNGEWEGPVALWFDPETMQFKEHHKEPRRNYV